MVIRVLHIPEKWVNTRPGPMLGHFLILDDQTQYFADSDLIIKADGKHINLKSGDPGDLLAGLWKQLKGRARDFFRPNGVIVIYCDDLKKGAALRVNKRETTKPVEEITFS